MNPEATLTGVGVPVPLECEHVMPRLYEFVDNELDLGELQAMRDHMDGCESCTYEHDVRAKLKQVVREACFEPAPDELKARVAANIRALKAQLGTQ
jgi:mycothiol system anti-sigma-R factor